MAFILLQRSAKVRKCANPKLLFLLKIKWKLYFIKESKFNNLILKEESQDKWFANYAKISLEKS